MVRIGALTSSKTRENKAAIGRRSLSNPSGRKPATLRAIATVAAATREAPHQLVVLRPIRSISVPKTCLTCHLSQGQAHLQWLV